MFEDRRIECHPFIEWAMLDLRRSYYFILSKLRGRVRPGVKRMRTLGRGFYINMWRTAAEANGARFKALSDGIVEIERCGHRIRVCDNTTSLDKPMTLKLAGDKTTVRSLLAESGIPIPRHVAIEPGQFGRASQMLRSSRVPLVVKPAEYTSGGVGVSTNVTTVPQLRAAVAWASAFGPRILIEEQIEGDCYRVLVMDGEVLDTVVRHPPRIVGDGVSTVRQLLRDENKLRLQAGMERALCLIRLDPDVRNTLSSQGLRLRSRPAKGQIVLLKRVINDNASRENVPANGSLCSAILGSACKAAEIVGTRLAGIDVICSDPNVPLEISGGAIIEVNANPGFYYHYHMTDSGFPIADRVLNRFFDLATDQQ